MAGGVSAGSAVQQNSTSADRTKIHLSNRRPGVGSWYAATPVHSTVLKDRCHWPIGHIFPWYFLWPPFWSLRTPADTLPRDSEKRPAIIRAKKPSSFGSGENGWFGIIRETRAHPTTWPAATTIHRY